MSEDKYEEIAVQKYVCCNLETVLQIAIAYFVHRGALTSVFFNCKMSD